MIKTVLPYAETAMFTAVTLLAVHYFAGLDWPWALVIGLATATVLRALSRRVDVRRRLGG